MMPPRGSDPQGDAARLDAEYIVRQLGEMSPELKQRLVEEFATAFWSALRGYALPDAKNFANMRFLHAGSEVTQTAGGTTVGLTGGKGQFDIVNFVGGTADIDSATNARQLNVHVGGGGADCMFDFLVSSCFSSLAGFVEGTTYTALSGCTFKGYSTVQGVITYLEANSSNGTHTIFLCGTTSETVTLTYANWLRLYFYGNGAYHSGFTTLVLNGIESTTHAVEFYDIGITTVQAQSGTDHHPKFFRCNLTTVTTTGTTSGYTGAVFKDGAVGDFSTINSPLQGWDNTVIDGNTITGSVDLSKFAVSSGQDQIIRNNVLTSVSGAIKLNAPKGTHIVNNRWRSNTLKSTAIQLVIGGTTAALGIKISGNTFNACDTSSIPSSVIDITNLGYTECVITSNNFGYAGAAASGSPFILTSASTTVCAAIVGNNFQARNDAPTYIETDGGVSIKGVFVNSSFGLNTPDSFALNLLTGSSNNLYIGTGTITGAGASSATNIYALSSSPYVTIGNDANLSAERALTAGNGVGFTDGGANSTVTAALSALTADWTQSGAFDVNSSGKLKGTSIQASGLTGAVAASRYVGATASGAPASGTFAVGDFIIDQAGKVWVCTVAGSPGTWGDAAALSANQKIGGFDLIIDGGGSAITTGVKADVRIPYACTITANSLMADQSGSIVLDLWKDTLANFPPTVADTITASAKPTLSAADHSEDTTLTGWTTSVSAGDVIRVNVDSASTVTRVTLAIKANRT